jgi:two-component system nitrogen regulation sensor histidine kinase NtrY
MLGSLTVYLEGKVRENNLSSLDIYAIDGTRVLNVVSSNITPSLLPSLSQELLGKGLNGEDIFRVETTDVGDIVRAISPILQTDGNKVNSIIGAVGVSYYIPENLVGKLHGISAAFEEYEQLKVLKNPIKMSYFITLLIMTLVIVFLATWVGIYMSNGITIPIQNLAKGTHEVSSGNLDYHIPGESDDEVGTLVRSFNHMTVDLKSSNSRLESTYLDLKNTNQELDQRRTYMEIILKNVAAGVISIDKVGAITTINKAAEEMFAIDTGEVLGRSYKEVLNGEHLDFLKEMIREMNSLGIESIERQIKLDIREKSITVMVNLTLLNDDDGKYIGMVAVFDDISNLLKAQRMTAWREIARRIAHEIKNPLTPIQLSAQRLRRKYGDKFANNEMVFDECTKTIINQVEELKVLVDEFSSFARMPAANPIPNDLNEVVKEAVALYQGGHKNIAFQCLYHENMPIISIDRDQIKRAVINLLDNSVDAIEGEGTIDVKTSYDSDLEIAKIEVTDSGCGISREDKAKLFEPYFSTKKSGTGLGLAILNNIVADHQGYVRVLDNFPVGTKFVVALNAKASRSKINNEIEDEEKWQAIS